MAELSVSTTPSPVRPRAAASRSWPKFGWLIGLLPIAALMLLWQGATYLPGSSPLLLPSVPATFAQLIELARDGTLWSAIGITTLRALSALVIASVIGMAVGLLMARYRAVNWFFDPLIAIGFPMPAISLLPIFVLWFGIDSASKIFVAVLSCFFPIALSTLEGARQVNARLLWSAEAMGTSGPAMFWRVVLPASLPFVASGVRVALPHAVIVTFVAEMISGGGGLGSDLIFAYRFSQSTTVFACLVAVLILGLALDRALLALKAWALPWDNHDQTT